MRLINADALEWDLMGAIEETKRLIKETGLQADEITYAKLNSYEGFLKRVREERTIDALPIGTGAEYRADEFDIVKKLFKADNGDEAETFVIARRKDIQPDPDCAWR